MQQLMKIIESWLKDTHYRVFSDVFQTFVQLSRSFWVVFRQFSGEKLFCYLKFTRSIIIYIDILDIVIMQKDCNLSQFYFIAINRKYNTHKALNLHPHFHPHPPSHSHQQQQEQPTPGIELHATQHGHDAEEHKLPGRAGGGEQRGQSHGWDDEKQGLQEHQQRGLLHMVSNSSLYCGSVSIYSYFQVME